MLFASYWASMTIDYAEHEPLRRLLMPFEGLFLMIVASFACVPTAFLYVGGLALESGVSAAAWASDAANALWHHIYIKTETIDVV